MRTITCHCGASAEVQQGFLREEAEASGFFPVVHFGGGVRWFCPAHTVALRMAMRAMEVACGGNTRYLVPPMMERLTRDE